MRTKREKVKLFETTPNIIPPYTLTVSKTQNNEIKVLLPKKSNIKVSKKISLKEPHVDLVSKFSLQQKQADTASKSSLLRSHADSAFKSLLPKSKTETASKLVTSHKIKAEGAIRYDISKNKTFQKLRLNSKTGKKNNMNIMTNKSNLKSGVKEKVSSQYKKKSVFFFHNVINDPKPEWLTATLQRMQHNEEPYNSLILGNNPYTYYHLIDYLSSELQCKQSYFPFTHCYKEQKPNRSLLEGRFHRYLGSSDLKLQKEKIICTSSLSSSFMNEQPQLSYAFDTTSPYDLLDTTLKILTPSYDDTQKKKCQKVSTHATTLIFDKVQLIGKFPITLGENTKLNPYVCLHALRGPIQIGDSNVLEEFVTLRNNCSEPLVIGHNNIIRCHAYISNGTQIGNFNEIGYATLLQDKTVIENHCIVAQGSHLTCETISSDSVVFGRDTLIKRTSLNDLNGIKLAKSPLLATFVSN
ncbi:uncharacterized protein LOC128883345 isoform X1 [Hylaeus volcanicus]|uniref:uncharacterized protein LOC128883345 isoform X1 n=1 Tax=Hylaeus volcanicus TaxID=313075 RepID=UPI0023B797D9|nr:uncharacterized protein LOC128883345 isoform X1 [Hylaeus volcanicus]